MGIKQNLFIVAGAALLSTGAMAQDTSMSFFITSKGLVTARTLVGLQVLI